MVKDDTTVNEVLDLIDDGIRVAIVNSRMAANRVTLTLGWPEREQPQVKEVLAAIGDHPVMGIHPAGCWVPENKGRYDIEVTY